MAIEHLHCTEEGMLTERAETGKWQCADCGAIFAVLGDDDPRIVFIGRNF